MSAWASHPKFDTPESSSGWTLMRRHADCLVQEQDQDLPWERDILDSMIRGLPIGIITIWRVVHGGDVIEVVLDGARRVQAMRTHLFADSHAGLVVDIDQRAVTISDPSPRRLSTFRLGSSGESMRAARQLGGEDGNLFESVSCAVMGCPVLTQTFVGDLDDARTFARRTGCSSDRVDWFASPL